MWRTCVILFSCAGDGNPYQFIAILEVHFTPLFDRVISDSPYQSHFISLLLLFDNDNVLGLCEKLMWMLFLVEMKQGFSAHLLESNNAVLQLYRRPLIGVACSPLIHSTHQVAGIYKPSTSYKDIINFY